MRVAEECIRDGKPELANLLKRASVGIESRQSEDRFVDEYTHEVTFYGEPSDLSRIPLRQQADMQKEVQELLNIAGSRAKDEAVTGVHFEYLDEDIKETIRPTLPLVSNVSAGDISRIWKNPNSIKLFVSHRDADKVAVSELKEALENYGISAFVAHQNIEHDEEWQKEIERALVTMDLMLVFMTEKFFESIWTNQEIGYALGSGVNIIKVKVTPTSDPKGFLSSRQAMRWNESEVHENARNIWTEVKKYLKGQTSLSSAVITRFENSPSYRTAESRFEDLQEVLAPTDNQIERIVRAYNLNSQISEAHGINFDEALLKYVNRHSSHPYAVIEGEMKHAQTNLAFSPSADFDLDDEIPF